jgi:hypothetical protein
MYSESTHPRLGARTSRPRPDRRRQRSASLHQALELLLASTAEHFALTHLVLADRTGLMHAGAGPAGECHALSAFGPMLDRALEPQTRRMLEDSLVQYVPAAGGGGLSVRRIDVGGQPLYVCALGGGSGTLAVAVQRAASGAQRILTAEQDARTA